MLVYDTMSTTNSSPQTTEINAKARADTLMKWVHLGLLQADAVALLAAMVDDEPSAIISGAVIANVLLYGQYLHAKNSGLESEEEGTETYG